eukprot:2998916-Amphidinium_carterae.1
MEVDVEGATSSGSGGSSAGFAVRPDDQELLPEEGAQEYQRRLHYLQPLRWQNTLPPDTQKLRQRPWKGTDAHQSSRERAAGGRS